MKRLILRTSFTLMIGIGLFCVTGCWDKVEINDLAIGSLVGVELDPDTGNQRTFFQMVNPKAMAGHESEGIKSPVYTYEVEGKGTTEITTEIADYLPRKLFPNHYQAMVFSERFAKDGLLPLLNLFERLYDRRSNLYVFVTDSEISKVVGTYLPLEKLPGNHFRKLIDMKNKSASRLHSKCRVKDMVENLDTFKSTVFPYIRIYDSKAEPNTDRYENIHAKYGNIFLTGAAVFNQDQMVGKLTLKELTYYRLLEENEGFLSEMLTVNGANVHVRGVRPKVKRKLTIASGVPEWQLQIKMHIQIMNNEQNQKLTTADLNNIKHIFNQTVKQKAITLFNLSLENNWDLFGLQNRIRYQRGEEWKILRNDPDIWLQTKPRITVESRVTEIGEIIDPYVRR